MEEELTLDNIIDDESLFSDNTESSSEQVEEQSQETDDNTEKPTDEVDTSALFGDNTPENVDSGEVEENTPSDKQSSSPDTFFSSIASSLAEEGIFPNLDDDTIKQVKTSEDLRRAIEQQMHSELSEQQQRIQEALNADIAPDTIRQYENIINFLNNVSEEDIRRESAEGEELRRRLLYQDYVNRGFSNERAQREVSKALQNGTDVDDALEALISNKNFYVNNYNSILDNAKAQQNNRQLDLQNRAQKLKDNMLKEDTKYFGDLDISKRVRQDAYDAISKPVWKDEQGNLYTALQKYEAENKEEFLAKIGLLYTLTDGFSNIDKLVNTKVKRGIKRGLRDLEDKINNTSRDQYGNLKYVSGVSDSDSYLGKGIKLDI